MPHTDSAVRDRDDAPVDGGPDEWGARLGALLAREGPVAVRDAIRAIHIESQRLGVVTPVTSQTAYVNTIRPEDQPVYPGDRELERRIRSLVRWNAVALVVRANREHPGLGGHLSTFASIATLYEVGQNHFFRGREHECGGDHVYFQGHASPGNYARAFLEGRLDEDRMSRFRREVGGHGLSSYPHPWLMPDFWEYPTVSMGLGPIQAIYRARFMRYLRDRKLADDRDARVWCFVGDGEMDEPEALAALALAARERLDNLTLVVNCNLQRLDGPVRGNGKIIQELEALFRGLGWRVFKLVWGSGWDPLFARDDTGALAKHLGGLTDGDYQRCATRDGAYLRDYLFGEDDHRARLVQDWTDDQLASLKFGGHDPDKVYAAYEAAAECDGVPSVILAKTVKGYALGEHVEARNVTHQQKTLGDDALRELRDRFDIPVSDDAISDCPFYRPPDDDPAIEYLHDRRQMLGGHVPKRAVVACAMSPPSDALLAEYFDGSGDRPVSTTMALVRMLAAVLKGDNGPRIVPIVPDEARTFGMDALFHECGIYSSVGQKYEPVDADSLLHYREAKRGQILEEGITEAGAMASFIAAGTAYANHGLGMIPFYFFYSMFGLQRVGDLVWAAGDARARGFLVGATAGRTTLNGEGLQHQDGHSHVLALPVPNLRAYDPAYAYELAVIIQDGMRRMYRDDEDVLYYMTAYNETYEQPAMPTGAREGILNGMYRLRRPIDGRRKAEVRLLGSGPLIGEAIAAQELLADRFDVAAEVWSVTSYKLLWQDALRTTRWNMLHPSASPRMSWIAQRLGEEPLVHVAVSDYVRALPDAIRQWVPGTMVSLGTDGYGRSDTRDALRTHFEVDARAIAFAALSGLSQRDDQVHPADLTRAMAELEIDPEKLDSMSA